MDQNDHDLLIELNAKMDYIKTTLLDHIMKAEQVHGQHAIRLSALEEWRWKWAAVISALALMISMLGNILGRMLWH